MFAKRQLRLLPRFGNGTACSLCDRDIGRGLVEGSGFRCRRARRDGFRDRGSLCPARRRVLGDGSGRSFEFTHGSSCSFAATEVYLLPYSLAVPKRESFVRRFLRALGPGVVTGAADDDPSGIATYSIAGAQLGTGLLWTAWLTWPLMAAVQMGKEAWAMLVAILGTTISPYLFFWQASQEVEEEKA